MQLAPVPLQKSRQLGSGHTGPGGRIHIQPDHLAVRDVSVRVAVASRVQEILHPQNVVEPKHPSTQASLLLRSPVAHLFGTLQRGV